MFIAGLIVGILIVIISIFFSKGLADRYVIYCKPLKAYVTNEELLKKNITFTTKPEEIKYFRTASEAKDFITKTHIYDLKNSINGIMLETEHFKVKPYYLP